MKYINIQKYTNSTNNVTVITILVIPVISYMCNILNYRIIAFRGGRQNR